MNCRRERSGSVGGGLVQFLELLKLSTRVVVVVESIGKQVDEHSACLVVLIRLEDHASLELYIVGT